MHLESAIDQVIAIAGKGYAFRRGETIHTESSRKYEIRAFSEFGAIMAGTPNACGPMRDVSSLSSV